MSTNMASETPRPTFAIIIANAVVAVPLPNCAQRIGICIPRLCSDNTHFPYHMLAKMQNWPNCSATEKSTALYVWPASQPGL